jgi:hypothetical protein
MANYLPGTYSENVINALNPFFEQLTAEERLDVSSKITLHQQNFSRTK